MSNVVLLIPLADLRRHAKTGLRQMALLSGVVRIAITAAGELEISVDPIEELVPVKDYREGAAAVYAEDLSMARRRYRAVMSEKNRVKCIKLADMMRQAGYRMTDPTGVFEPADASVPEIK